MNVTLRDYQTVTSRLKKYHQSSPVKAIACCPAHEDNSPSMSIGIGDDGKLLTTCKTGCSFQLIVRALGLPAGEWFPPDSRSKKNWKLHKTWDYRGVTADNTPLLVGQVCEYVTPDGEVMKRHRVPNQLFNFSQPASKANPPWKYEVFNGVLYRWSETPSTAALVVVDDEYAVDMLREHSIQAVCSPHGFHEFGWGEDIISRFRGRSVALLVTEDAPEIRKVNEIMRSLIGLAKDARIIVLPDSKPGQSFTSWCEAFHVPGNSLRDRFGDLFRLAESFRTIESKSQPVGENVEAASYYRERLGNATPERLAEFADKLRLPPWAVKQVIAPHGPAFDEPSGAWLFPEYDGHGNIVGVSRRFPDGAKRSLEGSNRGLTLQQGYTPNGPLLIVEGQSDTIALGAANINAIGRPSNVGGLEHLVDFIQRIEWPHAMPIIVIGENDDEGKLKTDGSPHWPGKEGMDRIADALQQRLRRPVERALPPEGFKDARAWLTVRTDEWSLRGRAFLAAIGAAEPADPVSFGDLVVRADCIYTPGDDGPLTNVPTLPALYELVDNACKNFTRGCGSRDQLRDDSAKAIAAIVAITHRMMGESFRAPH